MKDTRKLRKLRLGRGLSQKQVGELLSCSNLTVCRWENGVQEPRRMAKNALGKLITILEKEATK
jgi:transcriptional regulator with XRE-family HTH domain